MSKDIKTLLLKILSFFLISNLFITSNVTLVFAAFETGDNIAQENSSDTTKDQQTEKWACGDDNRVYRVSFDGTWEQDDSSLDCNVGGRICTEYWNSNFSDGDRQGINDAYCKESSQPTSDNTQNSSSDEQQPQAEEPQICQANDDYTQCGCQNDKYQIPSDHQVRVTRNSSTQCEYVCEDLGIQEGQCGVPISSSQDDEVNSSEDLSSYPSQPAEPESSPVQQENEIVSQPDPSQDQTGSSSDSFSSEQNQVATYRDPLERYQNVIKSQQEYQSFANSNPVTDSSSQEDLVDQYQQADTTYQDTQDQNLAQNLNSDQAASDPGSTQIEQATETFGQVTEDVIDTPRSAFSLLKARQQEQQFKKQQEEIIALKNQSEEKQSKPEQNTSKNPRIAYLRQQYKIPDNIPDDDVYDYITKGLATKGLTVGGTDDDPVVSLSPNIDKQKLDSCQKLSKQSLEDSGQMEDSEFEGLLLQTCISLPNIDITPAELTRIASQNSDFSGAAKAGANVIIPYDAAEKQLELSKKDIPEVASLLKDSGVWDRVKDCSASGDYDFLTGSVLKSGEAFCDLAGPDSGYGGWQVTLARINALKRDYEQNPDGSGKLTSEEEEARREYTQKLHELADKQRDLLQELGVGAALARIDAPVRAAAPVAGKVVVKPAAEFIGEHFGGILEPVGNFIEKVVDTGADLLHRVGGGKIEDVPQGAVFNAGGIAKDAQKVGSGLVENIPDGLVVVSPQVEVTDQEVLSVEKQVSGDVARIKSDNSDFIDSLKRDKRLDPLVHPEHITEAQELVDKELDTILKRYSLSEEESTRVKSELRTEIIESHFVGNRTEAYVTRHEDIVPFVEVVKEEHPITLVSQRQEGLVSVNLSDQEIEEIVDRAHKVVDVIRIPQSTGITDVSDLIGAININLVDANTLVGKDQRRLINMLYTSFTYPDSYFGKAVKEFFERGGRIEEITTLFADLLAENKARFKGYEKFWGETLDVYNNEVVPAIEGAGYSLEGASSKVEPESITWMLSKECPGAGGSCVIETPIKDASVNYINMPVDSVLNGGYIAKSSGQSAEVLDGSIASTERNNALHAIAHENIHANTLHDLGIIKAVPDSLPMINTLEELTERNAILAEQEAAKLKPDIYGGLSLTTAYRDERLVGDTILQNLGVSENEIRQFALNQNPVEYINFLDSRFTKLSEEGYREFIEAIFKDGIISPKQRDLLLSKRANSIADIRQMSQTWINYKGLTKGRNVEHAKKYNDLYNIPEDALKNPDTYGEYIEGLLDKPVLSLDGERVLRKAISDNPTYLPKEYYSETYEGQRALNFQRTGNSDVNQAFEAATEEVTQAASPTSISDSSSSAVGIGAILVTAGRILDDLIPAYLRGTNSASKSEVKGISTEKKAVSFAVDANVFEQTVKRNLIKQKLAENGSIDKKTTEQIMALNILGPQIKQTLEGYSFTTGKSGVIQTKVERDLYKVEVKPIAGLNITVPKVIDLRKGGVIGIPITVEQGSGQVKTVALNNKQSFIKEVLAQENNQSEVKVGIISKDGQVLPWAGVEVNLVKVYQDEFVPLLSGWNLITLTSLPEKPLTASELLKQIAQDGGYATTVSTLVDGEWKSYVQRGDQVFSGDDFLIEVGKAYFVKSLKKSSLTFKGQPLVAPIKLDIKSGWNAIGIPVQSKSYRADDILRALNSSEADTVAEFDSGAWNTYVLQKSEGFGDNFMILPNFGIVLKSKKEVGFSP